MKEDLDQHFMIDRNLIKKIVNYSNLKKKDIVLEIGPGKGFLTKELIKKCKVIAVEKDESFKEGLSKLAKLNKNLEVVFGDVLKSIKKLKFNKVVSNIPYSISEPLFKKLFRIQPDLVVITVSQSFSDKLLIESKMGLQTSLFFNIEVKEKVARKAFLPRPKTDSAVIKLTPREEESLSIVEIILRMFVLLDDKKTKNALRASLTYGLKLTKNKAREVIESLNLDNMALNKNSGLLSFEEFKKLRKSLKANIKEK